LKGRKTLLRANVAAAIQNVVPLSDTGASRIVEGILEHMRQALCKHEEVKIHLFGTFYVLAKAERVGRNPRTGEEKVISARHTVAFRPGKEMCRALEKGLKEQ
jgi:integration host factor subunit alpha